MQVSSWVATSGQAEQHRTQKTSPGNVIPIGDLFLCILWTMRFEMPAFNVSMFLGATSTVQRMTVQSEFQL